MNPFDYHRAQSVSDAIVRKSRSAQARFIGGGTNILDLMKENVEFAVELIDVNRIGDQRLNQITTTEDGGLTIGSLVTNSRMAYDNEIRKRYPLLSQAILAGASPQLRNMATCGGNLLQRTRCYYFYDRATACNKRSPGSGCDAKLGVNRIHAVLGTSETCIATHPSDMCVALAALDARVRVTGPKGERSIEFRDFHRLPEDRPEFDTTLQPDELITAIELPAEKSGGDTTYLKIRDRSSYAFALLSVAVRVQLEAGKIREAQVALGGVAHKPWRDFEAEEKLVGQVPNAQIFEDFAKDVFKNAEGFDHNAFKIPLGQRAIVRAFADALNREAK